MWVSSRALSYEERMMGIVAILAGVWAMLFFNSLYAYTPAFITSALGWVALVGTIAFYLIQNLRLFIKKDPKGLSFLAFTFLLVGIAALTLFGFLISSMPVLLGNLFSTLGTLGILWGIVRWKKNDARVKL